MKKLLIVSILLFSILFITGCQNIEKIDSSNTELTCVTSWSCGNWTNCINGTQTRICIDASGCKNSSDAPIMKQSCTTLQSSQTNQAVSSNSAKIGQNYIEKGDTIKFNGKTIRLERVGDNAAIINLEGEMITLKTDTPRSINGIRIMLVATFDTTAATIDLSYS